MKSRLEAIDVLNRNIVVPGCRFTKVGVEFDRVDEDTLACASATLQAVGSYGDWWWGDYLVAYARFRMEAEHTAKDLGGMAAEDKDKLQRHYVRNHGSVLNGRELADTQLERWKTASFYTSGSRLLDLSNEHHRQAMDGSEGDLAVAQDWLDKAKANGWSCNELRFEMKNARKAKLADPPRKVESLQHELFGACRWAMATTKRVPDMDLDEVERTLANLAPLLALAESLAAKRRAMAGDKKSLLPAA